MVTLGPLVIPFPQIGPATVKLTMHMYRASRCQFDSVGNPTRFVYSIKRQAEMQTFDLKGFRMLTEGCVYDRFNYEIYGVTAGTVLGDPPGFVKEEPSMLRFNVSTNDLMSIGTYEMVL